MTQRQSQGDRQEGPLNSRPEISGRYLITTSNVGEPMGEFLNRVHPKGFRLVQAETVFVPEDGASLRPTDKMLGCWHRAIWEYEK